MREIHARLLENGGDILEAEHRLRLHILRHMIIRRNAQLAGSEEHPPGGHDDAVAIGRKRRPDRGRIDGAWRHGVLGAGWGFKSLLLRSITDSIS